MLGSEEIRTSGVVRASDPGVGMGIEFTDLENTVQHQLQHYVETMDDQAEAPKGKATARS